MQTDESRESWDALDIEILLESVAYSKYHVRNSTDSSYPLRQEKLERLERAEAILRAQRDKKRG